MTKTVVVFLLGSVAAAAFFATAAVAQTGAPPAPTPNYNVSARSDEDRALPNRYARNETFFQIPLDLKLGSASGIAVDRDGKSVWIFQRCGGQDYCIGSDADTLIKFDETGRVVKRLGKNMFVYPHGLWVDQQGYLWVTDLRTNTHVQGNQSAKRLPGAKPMGAQVHKIDPETGAILLSIGVAGEYGTDRKHLSQPSAVITNEKGEIFVADGHDSEPSNNRILKYDKNGKFLKAWGKSGAGAEDLDSPHALAFDSLGRLHVADRGHNRILVYDQNGKLLETWKQFGRPSGLFILNDRLYAADTQSSARDGNAYIRGIHIGDAKTGKVTDFIPDPLGNPTPWFPLRGTTGAEGLVAIGDAIYISQVTPPGLAKLTPKTW